MKIHIYEPWRNSQDLQTEQAGKLGKKSEWKIWYIVFRAKFNKSHVVYFHVIFI